MPNKRQFPSRNEKIRRLGTGAPHARQIQTATLPASFLLLLHALALAASRGGVNRLHAYYLTAELEHAGSAAFLFPQT
jgi:hypothetical protein